MSSFREKLKTRILKPGEAGKGGSDRQHSVWLRWSQEVKRSCRFHPLTRSLVFDEEKLQTLLEGVFVHIKLHLDPDRGEKRLRERGGSCVGFSNDLPEVGLVMTSVLDCLPNDKTGRSWRQKRAAAAGRWEDENCHPGRRVYQNLLRQRSFMLKQTVAF